MAPEGYHASMSTEDIAAADVPDLVSRITELTPVKRQFWFRGQGCESYGLTPSLWRKLNHSAAPDALEPKNVLAMETRLLTRFRQRSLPYWPDGYPQSDWEHLFAMQHYGIPTRLLDWTTNLLMAVFFALQHDPARCPCQTGSCQPTIWVLDPSKLNHVNPRLDGLPVGVLATSDQQVEAWAPGVSETVFAPSPIAIYGTHNTARITAQHGSFTVGGKTAKPLDELMGQVQETGILFKASLTTSRDQLTKQLRLLGITRSAAYPGLAEVAYDITEEEM